MSNQNNKNQKNGRKGFFFKFQINFRSVLLVLLILFFLGPLLFSFSDLYKTSPKIPLSEVLTDIKSEKVKDIKITDDRLTVYYKNGDQKTAVKESQASFTQVLKDTEIDPTAISITVEDRLLSRVWLDVLGLVLPLGLMALFFIFIFRQARGAQDTIFSFGKSQAKLFAKGKQSISFKDVAGVEEAKKELEEVVDFLKNPAKYSKIGARTPKGVLLFGPAGVGKCVVGDTLVLTNKGVMEIQDIPKYFSVEVNGVVHGAKVSSFIPENISSREAPASHWYDLGVSSTVKLTTKMGHEIEATPEHPLVVVNNEGELKFQRTEELQVGDYIPIKTNDQMFGNYRRLTVNDCYVLGLLTGDGCLTIKDRVCFSTSDRELLSTVSRYFEKKFAYKIHKTKSRKYDFEITSHAIKSDLLRVGLTKAYSRNKKIPDYVLMAPKEQVVAFLQGLFDTDGSVYKTGKVEFATSSKKLAKQVSVLLLNFGVIHKFRVRGNNQFADSYQILISGSGLPVFAQQVGFRLKRKQEKLRQGTRIKRIWRYLKDILRYAKGIRKPLSFSNLFFDKVAKVEISQARVYDFTVPLTHSFISNGFISHNTLLARAVAGEAGVPFFSMAGSEFMEMLVGVGASRTRDLFSNAKKAAPSIIFIDEIDAIGRQRGGMGFPGGGHDEREQTLNQILVEMDGFNPTDRVVVVAATNRGDLLDPALLRPGRFDRRVVLDMPDKDARKAILEVHGRGKKIAKGVDWDRVSSITVGFSGADLENMLNEAAILAARQNKEEVETEDIEEASTKVKLGPAKKRFQTKEDKEITAFHEAGHALVTHFLPHLDPVQRVSVVARGLSLGHTLITPTIDRSHETKSRLIEQITAMLGGRAAEEVVFSEMTTGAANDISQATNIARRMVIDFGMSSLGPIDWGPQYDTDDMGRLNFWEPAQASPFMQQKIDEEVTKLMDAAYKQALKIIKEKRKLLDKVGKALIKEETLDSLAFEKLVGKKPPS